MEEGKMLSVLKFRRLVIPMALVFFAQAVSPMTAMGAEPQTVKIAAPAKTEVSLEQAINLVRQNFEIPKEFTQFTSGFNSYNNRQSWSLNWSNPNQNGGNFSAQVDVNSGEILNMYQWKNTTQPESGFSLPKVSYSEAKEIAQQLIQKILPTRIGELELIPEDTGIISLNNYGPITYSFQWKRMVNEIPFPSNFVSVQVNATEGQVTSYNFNWSAESLPSAQGLIGEDKARQSFTQSKMLELQYYVPPMMRPLSTTSTTEAQARLVYQLSTLSNNGTIDALTGEPVKLEDGQWLAGEGGAYDRAGYGGESKNAVQQPALTPEEQKEIDQNEQDISQEQAVEAVKKWVTIPDSLTLRNVSLGLNGNFGQNRVWTLDWNSDQPNQDGVQYIYAQVDAVTGELVSFNTSPRISMGSEQKTPIDRATAQQLAEDFLNKILPQRFQSVKLIENSNRIYKGINEGASLQEFNYQRVEKGVLFPNNGMNVMIDALSKTIISYNLNWGTLEFPDPSEGMAQSVAETEFLKARPLELKYVQKYNPNGLGEIRLVYQPSMENVLARSNVMDAKTGQFLDWQGQVLADQPRPYYFKDITGNFAEKEISLLGRAGIFGENGDQFKPNDNLTMASILKAMIIAQNGIWQNTNLKDDELMQKAKELGWLNEEVSPMSVVSREQMAKLQIRLLKLETVAQLPNLFQSPYGDIQSDSPAVGYTALVKGLGLMKIDGANFEPGKALTRAEGAYALMKTLEGK
jgi:hypothetical protein